MNITTEDSIEWAYYSLIKQFSNDELLGHFKSFALINNAQYTVIYSIYLWLMNIYNIFYY